jgi:phosphoribosylformylglycinamidine synthase subunit PurQ / glutaminase
MAPIHAIVIAGNGTNCEMEMAHACRLAGFDRVDIVPVYDLLAGEKSLDDYHFLCLAGGFMDGDDLGSAKAAANVYRHARIGGDGEPIASAIGRLIDDGKCVLGICNGFQLMVKLGLLPGFDNDYFTQKVTLTFNNRGRFEDRWCYLKVETESPCIFTDGIEKIYLPVRHGEGNFVTSDTEMLDRIEKSGLVVFRYATADGVPTEKYPENPNGSVNGIAGICDPTGRLMGLMPHPEAFLHRTNHPRWTREELPEKGDGTLLFENVARYLRTKF